MESFHKLYHVYSHTLIEVSGTTRIACQLLTLDRITCDKITLNKLNRSQNGILSTLILNLFSLILLVERCALKSFCQLMDVITQFILNIAYICLCLVLDFRLHCFYHSTNIKAFSQFWHSMLSTVFLYAIHHPTNTLCPVISLCDKFP